MFPDVSIFGVDLYEICIMVGIVLAFVSYRIVSDKIGIESRLYNFGLILGTVSVVLGFVFASLVQSLYNFIEYKTFEKGGMTFLGGLICSALIFIGVFFFFQKVIYKNGNSINDFGIITVCIIPSIVIAHSIGRIGCFCAGCCYGIKTDSFIGVNFLIDGTTEKRLPTQLFEAGFLLIFYFVMLKLIFDKKTDFIFQIYLIGYGFWRFLIEFLRGDDRGSIGLSFLSPSQLLSIIMIIFGIVLIIIKEQNTIKRSKL